MTELLDDVPRAFEAHAGEAGFSRDDVMYTLLRLDGVIKARWHEEVGAPRARGAERDSADEMGNSMNLEKLRSELEDERFFGSVELKFEAGKIVLVRKTETIKPPESFRDYRGGANGSR